jgi:hypothetical protein
MANAWLAHVKKTMKAHKGQKFSAVLKLAKKTYKKGGALAALAPASVGGRRRTRRVARRHRK